MILAGAATWVKAGLGVAGGKMNWGGERGMRDGMGWYLECEILREGSWWYRCCDGFDLLVDR